MLLKPGFLLRKDSAFRRKASVSRRKTSAARRKASVSRKKASASRRKVSSSRRKASKAGRKSCNLTSKVFSSSCEGGYNMIMEMKTSLFTKFININTSFTLYLASFKIRYHELSSSCLGAEHSDREMSHLSVFGPSECSRMNWTFCLHIHNKPLEDKH